MAAMNISVVAGVIAGLMVGLVIGWLASASRSTAALAAARAELDSVRSAQDLTARALSSASEDAARRQSSAIGGQVAHIIDPLRGLLAQMSEELRRTEHHRINAYAGLSEQVRGMHAASAQLTDQTRALTNALHTPQIRGRWGEVQLERVVELAGMSRHCDFATQVGADGTAGSVRPDMVVHLAGGRTIVVDAKVPLHAYLRAVDTDDPDEIARLHTEHGRALRNHITQLASKAYWSAFDNTPEMVVLFVPSDPVLEAAVRAEGDLIEFGFTKNVVLTTPATLVALLRTVALGWRHDAMARDAATIHQLGTELHHRLGGVLGHLDRLGGSLRRAVESFNSTVGAVDARVGVTARKLAELDALQGEAEHTGPTPIDITIRSAGGVRTSADSPNDDQWATSPGG
ncbi:DNA recombination protein RmuC [Gordonia sp. Z-3]|jgi:DNA recombination protein RmuC|uniref:DNA recombination protein RmuC n=1 Tax=Gordonia tangerina TaxID=2911060 RepID=A0ABS9DNF5_9ACTN|nr:MULTISPECIES: DNA recombination protein RmuC [Gordonia]MAU80938.1 DNA recombination protein RmuC [Gordonia sp. (in: high G+C Gram-positive bacteria)]MCF3939809.1 DNA recombination protein RmuC [Gordonia tangerina]MED5799774.1 DNA recombination protein RmuC [Gordonia sp. Z-3]